MSLNAYIPQDNGNLKHVAEAEASPDDLAEFVEALQEGLRGSQKDGPFVVLDIDAGFSAYVEFEEEEVVEVKRVLKIGGVAVNNGSGQVAEVMPPKAAPKRSARKTTGTKKTAAKTATRKPAAKAGTAKRTVKKAPASSSKAPAKKSIKGTGFKRNAASAE